MAAQAGVAQDHGASTEGLGAVPPPATHPVYSTYRNYECYLLVYDRAPNPAPVTSLGAALALDCSPFVDIAPQRPARARRTPSPRRPSPPPRPPRFDLDEEDE